MLLIIKFALYWPILHEITPQIIATLDYASASGLINHSVALSSAECYNWVLILVRFLFPPLAPFKY